MISAKPKTVVFRSDAVVDTIRAIVPSPAVATHCTLAAPLHKQHHGTRMVLLVQPFYRGLHTARFKYAIGK